MRLLLLHLSDLHFCEPAHENASLSRIQQLASAVGSLPSTPDIACVVVSGDIAYSGRPPEYEIAARFFVELRGELTGRLGGTSAATIFVPGNHDCDFALETS